ncbi:agamous MADS-box protein AGL82 [Trifolium repens]|nr:agamous MADS-box protein AGL82 [Trifolium repens]
MGRGRISMELIQKEKSRKLTFQKRKKGLLKKAHELSTLCGVDVCIILYAPNFEGQGYNEPETWPNKNPEKVQRILQKYYNTTIDRRPKIYDAQEYFKERMKKVEFDISKVRKQMLRIMYPTWDESFNSLGDEQMRLFASTLDTKLDACNQKMNMLKGDLKGKTIAHESYKVDKPNTSNLTSTPNSYFNLMQNNMSQAQIYPPLMNISDKNSLGFWPLHLGQSYQPSATLSSAQGSYYVESDDDRYTQSYPCNQVDNNWAKWVSHADANIFHDSKFDTKKKDEVENVENLSPYYYNGNTMTMQSYPIGMHTLPLQNLPNLPPQGYQLNAFYDIDILQAHMFNNYMDGRK